jgi:hypothetical protein
VKKSNLGGISPMLLALMMKQGGYKPKKDFQPMDL